MPNLISLGFIDTSILTARLLLKYKAHMDAGAGRVLLTDKLLRDWPGARRAVVALAGAGLRVNDGILPKLHTRVIERYRPGDCDQWEARSAAELCIPLIVGPGAMIYAGAEGWGPLVGMAFAVMPGELSCIVNHGKQSLILLRASIVGDDEDQAAEEAPSEPDMVAEEAPAEPQE